MRKQALILFLLFALFRAGFPQQLPIPEICAVTVDSASGKPLIFWKISDTTAIDGFIIKRVIWDGTGVVDGTLNNVAVIENRSLTGFLDTTHTYNTEALPQLRQERYVVTSFKDNNGTPVYSGFSNEGKTVLLRAGFDTCKNVIKLSWKTGNNDSVRLWLVSPRQQLLTVTRDTQFVYLPQADTTYTFILSQTNDCIDSVVSNIASVTVSNNQQPRLLYIASVDNRITGKIGVKLSVILPESNAPRVLLLRDGTTIRQFNATFEGTVYDSSDNASNHTYRLVAVSRCNDTISQSNLARNMLLKAGFEDRGTDKYSVLQWQKYDYWQGDLQQYNVYFSVDSINYENIASLTDTVYSHNLNDLILNRQLPSTLYYYISAAETGNPYARNSIVYSNIAKLNPPPLIFVPNAILPYSSNDADRRMVIYADFIDSFNLKIFDRNGRMIFESNDVQNTLDGRLPGGQLAPRGTYLYIITYTVENKSNIIKGSISVIY